MTITATPDIDISLDADSSVTVSNTEPPRIELLRGNAYFDVRNDGAGKLQVKVGTTYIRDIGTRFSVSKSADRGQRRCSQRSGGDSGRDGNLSGWSP